MSIREYAFNALVGLDEWANTLTGGKPGQTISSRAAQARDRGQWWGCHLCRFLDWLQSDHCTSAIKGDIQRDETVDQDLKEHP